MNTHSDGTDGPLRGERGASLVEFALIFPFFMMVVLGMFSGGQSYNRKISMTNATGEASRYGASLAPSTQEPSPDAGCTAVPQPGGLSCGLDRWVNTVAAAVIQNASGDLNASVEGRRICVAYVHPAATAATHPHAQSSHLAVFTTNDTVPSTVGDGPSAQCFNDGRGPDEKRVQIEVTRRSPIDALFVRTNVTLTARSVTRFEAASY